MHMPANRPGLLAGMQGPGGVLGELSLLSPYGLFPVPAADLTLPLPQGPAANPAKPCRCWARCQPCQILPLLGPLPRAPGPQSWAGRCLRLAQENLVLLMQ